MAISAENPNVGGLRPELRAQWELFSDWCQSWDTEPVPATAELVGKFLAAFAGTRKTQARRVRAIRPHHEAAGIPLDLPGLTPTMTTVWRDDLTTMGVGEALAQLPRYGAPRHINLWDASGLRGRRDEFLIVLTGTLELSRDKARQVTSADVHLAPDTMEGEASDGAVTIKGQSVPRDQAPDRCPACAVTRWLRIVTALHHGHHDRALDLVDITNRNESRYDCQQPSSPSAGWADVGPLLLSLDQKGWERPGTALSTRSITTILHSRQVATGRREDPVYQRPIRSTRFDNFTPDDVYAAAGDLDDKVAQALLRTQRLLAEMERLTGSGDL